MTRTFVFDLDGVIRHWNPNIVANAERSHGLPEGALPAEAFEPSLLLSVVTGVISDDAWRTEIARRLHTRYPDADAQGAVASWSAPHGDIIPGSFEVLSRASELGKVCLLSNATSRLGSDLAALGITDAFDHIFNSSEIGFAKPDDRVFANVERTLNVEPQSIVYVDDGAGNVDAAAQRGWTALLAMPNTHLDALLAPYLM